MRSSPARLALLLGGVLLLAACSGGGTGAVPTVEDPWLRSTPNGLGAAYFMITMPNDDRLIAADVDPSVAGRVEVHEVVDDAGRMLMREVDGGIALPAGEPVALRPGGLHLMLFDMPEMLDVGSTVVLTLRFSEADPVTVVAEVREGAGSHTSMDMGTMDHGTSQSGSMSPGHGSG